MSGAPGAAVWTGSTNFTDDSWTLQENNILTIPDAQMATSYARDFADLWAKGDIEDTGAFDTQHTSASYQGEDVSAQVFFSPGRGLVIDYDVRPTGRAGQTPGADLQHAAQLQRADRRVERSLAHRTGARERDL